MLVHEGIRTAKLAELEQDNFSGGYRTKSYGRITDYNLMVRKGNGGFAYAVELTADSMNLQGEEHPEYKFNVQTLFVRDGYADVKIGGDKVTVLQDQQLILEYESREKIEVSVTGEGHAVHCRIFYN